MYSSLGLKLSETLNKLIYIQARLHFEYYERRKLVPELFLYDKTSYLIYKN